MTLDIECHLVGVHGSDINPSEQTGVQTTEVESPYQKVVRISPNNKLMITGGTDGILRVWTFPDLNLIHEIEAHDASIKKLMIWTSVRITQKLFPCPKTAELWFGTLKMAKNIPPLGFQYIPCIGIPKVDPLKESGLANLKVM